MNCAIVTAAGQGTRFGSQKTLHLLKGKAMLAWAISNFENSDAIQEVVVTYPTAEALETYQNLCKQENFRKVRFVRGGETRFDSVRNAFRSIRATEGIILIHDAARPLVSKPLIERVFRAAETYGAVIPVVAVNETVKQVEQGRVVRTIPREQLFVSQTPQAFRAQILKDAYSKIEGPNITDEAMMVELTGYTVHTVEGDPGNLKVTTAQDVFLAESFL